ncbi:MAG: L,D-transpeptidase family protein [Deltaproteobacteria bacterium]|nr:L,D-transpeptidase family protein [Deltaproteobacteria bacterium]
MQKTLLSIVILLCALLHCPGTALAVTAERLNLALRDRLEQTSINFSDIQTDKEANKMQRWLAVIYTKTGLQPLWVTTDGPGKKAEILFSVLINSEADGLIPEQYHVNRITSLWNSTTPEELIDLDTLLTLAFITYAHDAQEGRTHSRKSNPDLLVKDEDTSAFYKLAFIKTALSAPDFNQFMDSLLPSHKFYRNLRAALPRYQVLATAGGWSPVAAGKSIHPGEQDSRIPAIGKRLQIEGFLQSATTDSPVYDKALEQAVIQFQLRHGLTSDGVIGKSTITAMNIPAEQKVRQIIINLERWREEAHDLGKKYVLVDIAGFTLKGIENDMVMLEMPVIVGTQLHETPVFSDLIQYIDLNPYWNIPPSIARNELLADLRKNPQYLNKEHIRLFSDRTSEAREINPLSIDWNQVSPNQMGQFVLRQDPGKWNALGAIKFVFPNHFNVYMHDTPAQAYFKRSNRAFSHGCIRLGNPLKLAEFLLGGSEKGWSSEQVNKLISTGKRTIIRLPTPLPVHITYQTVTSDQNGIISFYTDIYDRDQQLEDILFKLQHIDTTTDKGMVQVRKSNFSIVTPAKTKIDNSLRQ